MKLGIIAHIDHGKTTIDKADLLIPALLDLLESESYIDFSKPIAYNARPPMPDLFEGRQFICKGKHQYREVREHEGSVIKCKWICQCGRTTK